VLGVAVGALLQAVNAITDDNRIITIAAIVMILESKKIIMICTVKPQREARQGETRRAAVINRVMERI
jgi:hypothetical protein